MQVNSVPAVCAVDRGETGTWYNVNLYIFIYIQYVVELNIYIIVVYYYIDIYQDT